MKFIIFENAGEIDLRTIKTFGVSVKDTANPIGFFGTGLKYAIAILAREGLDLEIQAGERSFTFKKSTAQVRGKDFDMILMNDFELPFTTHLGINWDLWQAFRELYCNAKDEGGGVALLDSAPAPEAGKTRVIIRGHQFEDLYHDRNSIVLNLSGGETVDGLEIFKVPSEYLYYRGIRVAGLPRPSIFTYNVTEKTELTEDRTVKHGHDFSYKIQRKTAMLRNKKWIDKILLADRNAWESDFNYSSLAIWNQTVSEEFKEAVGGYFRKNSDRCNKSAIQYFAEIHRSETPKYFEFIELDRVEAGQPERAKQIAARIFPDFTDYAVAVVKTLVQNTMAMAVTSENRMVLSRQCFDMGTKFLVSTMIEEYVHLKTGHGDMTRELQSYLFDTICTIAEKHILREAI